MLKYLVLFSISFCASLAVTPLVRSLALRVGALDLPGERKVHTVPVPRLGGVSIVLSGLLAIAVGYALERLTSGLIQVHLWAWVPVLVGAAIVFMIGAWDDLRPLSAGVKFMFQALAALVAIWLGVRIEEVSLLGSGTFELGVLAIPLTFLWIVGITNAFNLVDGLDGLAAGLASIAAATCAAIFLLRGNGYDALLLVILLGALLGFLRYNFNPARIFLGDSGSQVIGYVFAVTAITGSQKAVTVIAVLTPLLVFGLPILDTLLSMFRRFVGGLRLSSPSKIPLTGWMLAAKRMFEADQGHIHHRLIALGFSHRNAVLVLYAITIGLSCLALISVLAQYRNAAIILITVGLATCVGIGKLGYKEVAFFRIETLLRWYEQLAFNRLFFLGFVDLVFITAAYWGAFVLKYDARVAAELNTWYLDSFPIVLMIQFAIFYALGMYRGVWRTMGVGDLLRVGLAVCSSVVLSYSIVVIGHPPAGTFSFFTIDLLVLGLLTGGARSAYRVLDYFRQRGKHAVSLALIYGAGLGGRLVFRELLQHSMLGFRPIGFIDDDPSLRSRTINGVSVLGSSQDLASILNTQPVTTLIVSSNKINGDPLKNAIRVCKDRGISVVRAEFQFQPLGRGHDLESNSGQEAFVETLEHGRKPRARRESDCSL